MDGDSLVGFVVEESWSLPGGGWSSVARDPGGRRVSVATADIVEVRRRESSPGGLAAQEITERVVEWCVAEHYRAD